MTNAVLWLVGNWQLREFEPALAWLNERAQCCQLEQGHPPETSIRTIPPGDAPAAVVLGQSRPGEFSGADVDQILVAAAGAAIFVLTGPWCEGELRSGTALPQGTRIEWRRWRSGLEVELAPLLKPARTGQRPRYELSPESQLVARNMNSVKQARSGFDTALVCTESTPFYEALVDALGQLRIKSRRPKQSGNDALAEAKLILYHGWPQVERHHADAEPQERRRRLLLLEWPRPDDAVRAAAARIDAILPLPFLLSDLATALAAAPVGPNH